MISESIRRHLLRLPMAPRTIRTALLLLLLMPDPPAFAAGPLHEIMRLRDMRDAQGLSVFFGHKDSAVREAAAWAAGTVQDSAHTAGLLVLLEDGEHRVRAGAAFALGQLGGVLEEDRRRGVVQHLLRAADDGRSAEVSLRAVEAVGKLADSSGLAMLVRFVATGPPSPVDWEAALSVGRCAYRGMRSREATAFVVRLLDQHTGPDRWKAAWALMRIGDADLLREHADRIAAAARSADADVRMFAAAALGRTGDRRVGILTLLSLLPADPDWRVRAAAAQALGLVAADAAQDALPALLQAVGDSSEHVSRAALAALGRAAPWPASLREQAALDLIAVVGNADGAWSAGQRREGLAALARGSAEDALRIARPALGRENADAVGLCEALAQVPGNEVTHLLLDAVRSSDPILSRAALEGLSRWAVRERPPPELRDSILREFIRSLGSKDAATVSTAAGALADSLFRGTGAVPYLLQALDEVDARRDPETAGALIEALGAQGDALALPTLAELAPALPPPVSAKAVVALEQITGRPHAHLLNRSSLLPETVQVDERALRSLEESPLVRVRTTRGTFVVRLLPGEAPFTSLNFRRLAQGGFYAGTVFHRVVPNFVVQGGDPRGDGWGGPEYAIRSEFGPSGFDRGTLGMASAGKDTEGSQFFITHSRQPHLDGRYTVFGRVAEGMEVVDALRLGDRILEMEVR